MARFSTLFLAVAIASPALWAGFVTHNLDPETALIRLLIAVPVAAIMLAVVRAVTRDYGKAPAQDKKPSRQESDGEPVRAEAVAGDPFPQRRADDQ